MSLGRNKDMSLEKYLGAKLNRQKSKRAAECGTEHGRKICQGREWEPGKQEGMFWLKAQRQRRLGFEEK